MNQAFNKRKAHNNAAKKSRKQVRQDGQQSQDLDRSMVSP